MANQILALHRVSARCYDLSRVRTGNVRDQLLRSTVVVNALVSEGVIGRGWPLLVYGAGAAGMNAAMHAANRRIDVTVVERTDKLFSTLSRAGWRRIDPTEYDWPHEHWLLGTFPRDGKTIPLPQVKAMSGTALAAAWRTHWRKYADTRYENVKVLFGLDASNLDVSDRGLGTLVDVTGEWTAGSGMRSTKRFGAVLSCIGFGDELVSEEPRNGLWNHYAGPRFWHDSDGIVANRALPRGVSDVVISGGGDGAMQDLQRVATKGTLFGRELFVKLEALIDGLVRRGWIAKPFPDAGSLVKFLSAEETGRRAFSWAPDRYGVPLAMKQWHDAFADPIFTAVRSWPPTERDWICEQVFRKELIENALEINWVMHDPTSGYAYALNRYLSLMLVALAENCSQPLPLNVWYSSAIHTIKPKHPGPCASAGTCIGKPHEVKFKALGSAAAPPDREANLVIIRHGVEPRPVLLGGRLPVPEQITPFDLPC